jgi:hypothetical protein
MAGGDIMSQKLLLSLILSFFFISLSFASELPKADKNGDYKGRTLHRYWLVTDKDYNGLNGRLSEDFPKDYESPRSVWPKSNVAEWPVVAKFLPGTILNGRNGNVGIIFINDKNGNPWIMISIDMDKYCFVRANKKYIKPVIIKEE